MFDIEKSLKKKDKKKKKHKKDEQKSHKKKKQKLKKRKHSTSSDSDDKKKSKKRKDLKELKEDKNNTEQHDTNKPSTSVDNSRSFRPMTKEEWDKKQSVVRRVFDESTGRSRLIKGDGEILEEIVSRDQHKAINKQATRGDGEYFLKQIGLSK